VKLRTEASEVFSARCWRRSPKMEGREHTRRSRAGLKAPAAVACAFALLIMAGQAPAAEGVIEINQTVVTAAGGFPFKITAPGAYQLTSNLTIASGLVNAINVLAAPVTIDLNGFTITGASGDASGIVDNVGELIVRNGTIQKVDVGVDSFPGPTIISNLTTANTTAGLSVADARVDRYSAQATSTGLACNGNVCLIDGATIDATGAAAVGVVMTPAKGSLIDSRITSSGDGVRTTGSAVVVGNAITISGTANKAINLGGGGGYGENSILTPASSVCVSGGVSMGDNFCNGVKQ
jgi:hypothetical protein